MFLLKCCGKWGPNPAVRQGHVEGHRGAFLPQKNTVSSWQVKETEVSSFLRKTTVSRCINCACKDICVLMYFLIKLLCCPLVVEE